MEKDILAQEKLHLEKVIEHIDTALAAEKQQLQEQENDILKSHRALWEECPNVVHEFDDMVAINASYETIRADYGHFARKEEIVKQLSYLRSTPYFGRIDFLEQDEPTPEEIYIGRYGFRNRQTREYEVYDWRSPIASMFYDSGVGAASYQCPAGTISGAITCKRQYNIEEGQLKLCYDTTTAVQDNILEEVLAGNTDKVLRVIIDTITREQNHAIRQPHDLNMLVTGPAGSGKTSVGMHRLAYLLYHNREYLSAERIVVLSRNQIFSSYISEILPELGEDHVQDVMFDSLICRGVSKEYKRKDYYEQVEFLLRHSPDSIRDSSISLKYSKEFLDYLKENKGRFREKTADFEASLRFYLYLLKQYEASISSTNHIYHYTKNQHHRGKLCYEDLLCITYLRILLGDITPMSEISHVVVDEAQDYNLLQLLIIRSLYPKAHFTILADANQAIHPLTSMTDMEKLGELFRTTLGIKKIALSKSYRSTAPINAYAFALLGIHNPDLYVAREGKAPEHRSCENSKTALRKLLSEIPSDKSVGILTVDLDSAKELQQRLGSELPKTNRQIQYLLKGNRSLEEKIVVMPIMLAKGLEFDVVIVWDDRNDSYWESNKNLKYLMCTRALHELYFLKEQ